MEKEQDWDQDIVCNNPNQNEKCLHWGVEMEIEKRNRDGRDSIDIYKVESTGLGEWLRVRERKRAWLLTLTAQ